MISSIIRITSLPLFILSLPFLIISALLFYQAWFAPKKFLLALKDPHNYWRTRLGMPHVPGHTENLLQYRIASIVLSLFGLFLLFLSLI